MGTIKLTYLPDVERISVSADELTDFNDNIGDYESIEITGTKNCTTTPTIQLYETDNLSDVDNKFFIDDDVLYLNPALFGLTTAFLDGIYKVDIKFKTEDGFVLISNCIFIDITLNCKVATLLKSLLEESKQLDGEAVSTNIHLLHYSLVNGSNCGCNCTDMCEVYSELVTLLLNIDPQITNDCGTC